MFFLLACGATLAVMWLLLPILLLSKMGEMLKVLRAIRDEQEDLNQWAERNDALSERIEQNTRNTIQNH